MKFANPLAVFTFSIIPYLLVAWGYMEITDGDTKAFWAALGVLLGLRLFFSIIESIGSVLCWRLYWRKIAVGNALEFLRSNQYPPQNDNHDDFLGYISRIQGDLQYPATLRKSAAEIEGMLALVEQLGIVMGSRAHSTFDAALKRYASK